MKLKTLEEIDCDFENYKQVLRPEAIKYIKEYRKEIESHSHKPYNDDCGYVDCTTCRIKYVQMRWIKMFFNITNKEIK